MATTDGEEPDVVGPAAMACATIDRLLLPLRPFPPLALAPLLFRHSTFIWIPVPVPVPAPASAASSGATAALGVPTGAEGAADAEEALEARRALSCCGVGGSLVGGLGWG